MKRRTFLKGMVIALAGSNAPVVGRKLEEITVDRLPDVAQLGTILFDKEYQPEYLYVVATEGMERGHIAVYDGNFTARQARHWDDGLIGGIEESVLVGEKFWLRIGGNFMVLTFGEVAAEVLRKRKKELTENIMAHNVIWRKLNENP